MPGAFGDVGGSNYDAIISCVVKEQVRQELVNVFRHAIEENNRDVQAILEKATREAGRKTIENGMKINEKIAKILKEN